MANLKLAIVFYIRRRSLLHPPTKLIPDRGRA
jgi:hypothetical protein